VVLPNPRLNQATINQLFFAKRKRKSGSKTDGAGKVERTSFASDPIIEALLKSDSREWKSKEKRMVKNAMTDTSDDNVPWAKVKLRHIEVKPDKEKTEHVEDPAATAPTELS
jgi:hypothetical protein